MCHANLLTEILLGRDIERIAPCLLHLRRFPHETEVPGRSGPSEHPAMPRRRRPSAAAAGTSPGNRPASSPGSRRTDFQSWPARPPGPATVWRADQTAPAAGGSLVGTAGGAEFCWLWRAAAAPPGPPRTDSCRLLTAASAAHHPPSLPDHAPPAAQVPATLRNFLSACQVLLDGTDTESLYT